MVKQCIVIGAGVGGLAAAIKLKGAGHEVLVLEANEEIGGKLSVLEIEVEGQVWRFDMGPSLFTQPDYHAALFEAMGERQADFFEYWKLETVCNYFFEDGKRVQAFSEPEKLANELHEKLGEDKQVVLDYLQKSQEKFDIVGEIFLNNPLQKLSTYLSGKVARAVTQMPKLEMLQSMNKLNASTFKNRDTVQLFDRFATYNGSDPYKSSALYSMIPSFEHGQGAYLPKAGMGSIVEAMAALAKRHGVAIRTGCKVSEVQTTGKSVRTVVLANGEQLEADVVVSNVDVNTFYKQVLKTKKAVPKSIERALSTSAIVFYWAMKGSYEELGLHNIFFSGDYAAEFEGLEKRPFEVPKDATVYVNITSKYIASDAPTGCENWFVMVNVPADLELSEQAFIDGMRTMVIEKLEKALGKPIGSKIVGEKMLQPRSMQEHTGAWAGAIYGADSNSLFSGFLRHPNSSSQYANLFFAGGTVHPGGGIPLSIKSGEIAARLANEWLGKS